MRHTDANNEPQQRRVHELALAISQREYVATPGGNDSGRDNNAQQQKHQK